MRPDTCIHRPTIALSISNHVESRVVETLGRYQIIKHLADGGMAELLLARSGGIEGFERHVVVKRIRVERARDQNVINMFLDEARLAASLNHQNVAQVFEVGEETGIHYLAMEYVHGQDLRALLAKAGSQGTRIPLELALTVVAGAAAGLPRGGRAATDARARAALAADACARAAGPAFSRSRSSSSS